MKSFLEKYRRFKLENGGEIPEEVALDWERMEKKRLQLSARRQKYRDKAHNLRIWCQQYPDSALAILQTMPARLRRNPDVKKAAELEARRRLNAKLEAPVM